MSRIVIIAATAHDKRQFEETTHLGQSLKMLANDKRLFSSVAYENAAGLPTVFNSHIEESLSDAIAVFTHDDVHIHDFWLSSRLDEALKHFDIVGVAGNKRRVPRQSSWAYVTDFPKPEWDTKEHLSGAICHLVETGPFVDYYGTTTPTECQLLDGVFMAAPVAKLISHNVRFDERFRFHFYDLDFCRTAVQAGLKLGTWPICMSHASGGVFGSYEWQRYRAMYYQKWDE